MLTFFYCCDSCRIWIYPFVKWHFKWKSGYYWSSCNFSDTFNMKTTWPATVKKRMYVCMTHKGTHSAMHILQFLIASDAALCCALLGMGTTRMIWGELLVNMAPCAWDAKLAISFFLRRVERQLLWCWLREGLDEANLAVICARFATQRKNTNRFQR